MTRACLSIVAWLMMLLVLAFARLPDNKGRDWPKEILESIKEKIRQRTLMADEEEIEEAIEDLNKYGYAICPHCGEPVRVPLPKVPLQTESLPQSLAAICRHCGGRLQLDVDAEKNVIVHRVE